MEVKSKKKVASWRFSGNLGKTFGKNSHMKINKIDEIVRMNMCMIYHNEGRVFHHSFIATDS
jgi:hypothetical protein